MAAELGYKPNSSARNLVTGTTGLLGIAVSESPESPFGLADFDYYVQLLTAATMAAVENGMALVVGGTDREGELFEGVDVDGMIVVDPVADDPLVRASLESGTPVVTTGRVPGEDPEDPSAYWIDNDHIEGTRSILDHLRACGGGRIALLTSLPVTSYTRDAIDGYRDWCEKNGQEPSVSIVEGPVNEGAGFDTAAKLLDGPDRPDAIYATLDRLALGTLQAARSRGLEVPRDLVVAGCTDSKASEWADPPLTSLALNPEEIGRKVIRMLISVVKGEPGTDPHQMVPTKIVARESTARLSSDQ